MVFNTIVFIIAQAFLIQSISGQCIGAYNRLHAPIAAQCAPVGPIISPCGAAGAGISRGFDSYGSSVGALAASNGGGLPISSVSPLAPNGVSVISENAIEGVLGVAGALPFLGTVALEGVLPTAGSGAVAFGCGNGEIAILNEDLSALGAKSSGYGYGAGALGYEAAGLTNRGANLGGLAYGYNEISGIGGCGCGRIY